MSSSAYFPIEVNDTIFSPQEQIKANAKWQNSIANAHRKNMTRCLCNGKPGIPVVVRRHEGKEGTSFILALWPETGLEHSIDCRFFSEDQRSQDTKTNLSAFEFSEDGQVQVFLGASLGHKQNNITQIKSTETTSNDNKPRKNSKTRNQATDIALLNMLWKKAYLNIYRGKTKEWFSVAYSLLQAIKKCRVGKKGTELEQFILLSASNKDKAVQEHNNSVLKNIKEKGHRLYVIGRLKNFDRQKEKLLLPLQDPISGLKILTNKTHLDLFINDRPLLENILDKQNGHIPVIALIEHKNDDWWQLIDLSGLATTTHFIPIESSYEIEFAEYLRNAQRVYLKPMTLDETEDSDHRPDFVLLDTKPRVFCEVWGMNTPEYLESKRKRIDYYRNRNMSLLNWNAIEKENLPTLPKSNI